MKTSPGTPWWAAALVALAAAATLAPSAAVTTPELPCLGFLLPDAVTVVTSAQCASVSQEPHRVVLIGADHEPLLVTVASLMPHAQYRVGDRDDVSKWQFNTAIGSLDVPLAQTDASSMVFSQQEPRVNVPGQTSVVLYEVHTNANVTSEPAVGDDLSHPMVFNQSTARLVATSECEAVSGVNFPHTSALCGKSEWTSLGECEAAAAAANSSGSSNPLVTVKQDGMEYAFGFVAATYPCSASDNSSLLLITSLVDVIPAAHSDSAPSDSNHSSGSGSSNISVATRFPTSEPVAAPTSSSGSSSADGLSSPMVASNSTALGGSASGSSSSSEVLLMSPPSNNGDEIIPDAVLSAAIKYPFAYLSESMNATTKSIAAYHISPRFLVANAEWLHDQDREQIKWVLFQDDKILVKKLWSEQDEDAMGTRILSFIVTIELERAYKMPGVRPVALPQDTGLDPSKLQLSFRDPALLLQNDVLKDGRAHVASLDSCGLYGDDAVLQQIACLSSDWPIATTSAPTVRMGFVLYDGKLVGVSAGYHTLVDQLSVRILLFAGGDTDRLGILYFTFVRSIQASEIPPEEAKYLESAVTFFEDGFPVDCGGVLIAPDAVLMTAECALKHQFSGCLLGPARYIYACNPRPEQPLVHPLYQVDAIKYNFAIVKLALYLPASALMALAPVQFPVGGEVVRADLSSRSGVRWSVVVESDLCVVSWAASVVVGTNFDGFICAQNANDSQAVATNLGSAALLGTYHNKPVLLGLQSSPGSDSPAHSYSSIVNVKDFISANVYGLIDNSDLGDDGASTIIPDEVFSASVKYPFAYLSDSRSATTKSIAAFLITPTFLVTNSEWVENQDDIKWVLFEDDKVPVKKLRVESYDGPFDPQASFLLLIELERGYRKSGVKPMLSSDNVESAAVQLSFLDPALLLYGFSRDETAHLAPLSTCDLSAEAAQNEDISCLRSDHQSASVSTAAKMGFVIYDDKLVGMTSGYHRLDGGRINTRVLTFSLGTRWNYLLTVFKDLEQSSGFSSEEAKYRVAVVRFYEDAFPVDCGGLVIAPDSILTTASCALAYKFSTTSLCRTATRMYNCEILPDNTVIHPLYQSEDLATSQYDFAIVRLKFFVEEAVSISLVPANFQVEGDVWRVDLSGPIATEACRVVESEQCLASWGSSISSLADFSSAVLQNSICADSQQGGSQSASTSLSSTALLGTYQDRPVLLGLQSSPAGSFPAHSYANIENAKDFIFTNVYGLMDSALTGDGADTIIPDDVLSASIKYPFAYLSGSINASTRSVAACLVYSTLLVVNTDWIDDREAIKWVLFEDDKIPVKNVWDSDIEGRRGLSRLGFLVIELERAYRKNGVRLVPVTTDTELESMAFQLSFFDPAVLVYGLRPRNDNAHLAPLSACGMIAPATTDDVQGLVCLSSKQQSSSSSIAVKMGFVMADNKLAGLVLGNHRLDASSINARVQSFAQLTRHDSMIAVYLRSQTSSESPPAESRYRASAVQFYKDELMLDYGGVLIAPDAVLTTASAVLAHNFSQVFVRAATEFGVLNVHQTAVHPLYKPESNNGPNRYDFAILELNVFISQVKVAVLTTTELATGSDAVRVDLSKSSGIEECMILEQLVCVESWKAIFSPSEVVDSSLSLSTGGVCAGNASTGTQKSNTAALFSMMDDTAMLLGLQVDQHSDPNADSYVDVLDAIEFINANTFGRRWGNEPIEDEAIPDEVFRASLTYPFVYLSHGPTPTTYSVVGVHISPSVVVTNAGWIQAEQSVYSVLFEDDVIRIQQMQFEKAYREAMGFSDAATSFSNLLLIKLERPYVRDTRAGAASSAKSDKALEVKFLDPILLQRGLPQDEHSSLAPLSICSSSDLTVSSEAGMTCVHSVLQDVKPSARGTPMRMGFLLEDGVLAGVGIGAYNLADEVNVPFARLDYGPRQSFVNYMTTLWSGDITILLEDTQYRGAAVRLIASGNVVAECGGMLIAPKFVLTTASCIKAHNINGVLSGLGNNIGYAGVLQNETVAHPLYQSSDKTTVRFNLALLHLTSPLTSPAPIALAPFEFSVGSDVVRVDLSDNSGASHVSRCQVLPSDRCGAFAPSLNATSLPVPAETVCAGNESVAAGDLSSSAALLGAFTDTLVLIGLQIGPDDDPHADGYVSILAAANFINAYAYGHTWGRVMQGEPSRLNLAPFLVGLRMTKNGQNFCGGALIASQFVLTAAHCVSDRLVKWVTIGVSKSDEISTSEEIQVLTDRIRIHPSFQNPKMYSFDAAILELATPAYHLPIPLDPTTDFENGKDSKLFSFYGVATTSNAFRIGAQEQTLPLWSNKKCQANVPGVDKSVMCAGGDEGLDACTGDSGSPLVIDSGTTTKLIGLVSAGYGCGQAGVPGLYTRISAIQDFIAAYTTKLPLSPPSPGPGAPSTPAAPNTAPSSATPSSPTAGDPTYKSDSATSAPASTTKQSGSDTTSKNDGKFISALVSQELPGMTGVTRGEVLNYLLGGSDHALSVSSELRGRLTSLNNQATLYSSEDLSELLRIIAAHDALPLNQREDRFGAGSVRRMDEQPVSATDSCVNGLGANRS